MGYHEETKRFLERTKKIRDGIFEINRNEFFDRDISLDYKVLDQGQSINFKSDQKIYSFTLDKSQLASKELIYWEATAEGGEYGSFNGVVNKFFKGCLGTMRGLIGNTNDDHRMGIVMNSWGNVDVVLTEDDLEFYNKRLKKNVGPIYSHGKK